MTLHHADFFDWWPGQPEGAYHAIVTDPPYGVREFEAADLDKLRDGAGGSWRKPPVLDGHPRAALPRFADMTLAERAAVERFSYRMGRAFLHLLRPGGHALVAANALLAARVQVGLERAGLEPRGMVLRLYRSFRGGNRPKGAETTFPDVATSLVGEHEPWVLVRKPMPRGMIVAACLARYETGGLLRGQSSLIPSERTPSRERQLSLHPTLKPQRFMREVVSLLLPMGRGRVLDPFAGGGSTLAAAEALGVECDGVERDAAFHAMARESIPQLAALPVQVEFAATR